MMPNYTNQQIVGIIDQIDPLAKQAARIIEDIDPKAPGATKKQAAMLVLKALLLVFNIKYNLTPEIRQIIENAFSILIDLAVSIYNSLGVFFKGNKPEVKTV
jgi:hypothetical protein